MVRRFLRSDLGAALSPRDRRWVYAGDTFNDAPMFARLPAQSWEWPTCGRCSRSCRTRRASSPARPRGAASRSWPGRCSRGEGEAGSEPGPARAAARPGAPPPRRPPLGVPEGAGAAAAASRRAAWWTSPRAGSSSRAGTSIRTRAIAVRVLTRDARETIDARVLPPPRPLAPGRCARALLDLTDTDSFRLVHGEGGRAARAWWSTSTPATRCSSCTRRASPPTGRCWSRRSGGVPGLKGVLGRDEVGRDDVEEDDGRGAGKCSGARSRRSSIAIRERGATLPASTCAGGRRPASSSTSARTAS